VPWGEEINFGGINCRGGTKFAMAVEHACGRIARRARHFLHQQRAPWSRRAARDPCGVPPTSTADPIARGHYTDFSPTIMALTPAIDKEHVAGDEFGNRPDTQEQHGTRHIERHPRGRPIRFTTGRVGSNSSLPTGEPILFGTTPLTRIL